VFNEFLLAVQREILFGHNITLSSRSDEEGVVSDPMESLLGL